VQWFEVPIEGEGLVQAEQALNRVQIPTLGPGYTVRGDRKSPEGTCVPRHMLAVLEAESAEDAEARVKDKLPDGDYDVGPAEPRQSGSG
jgi:hypothetical protein